MAEETVDNMLESKNDGDGLRIVESMIQRVQAVACPRGEDGDVVQRGKEGIGLERCAEEMDSLWDSEKLALDELDSNLEHAADRRAAHAQCHSDSEAGDAMTRCQAILDAMRTMLMHIDERLASVDATMRTVIQVAVDENARSQSNAATAILRENAKLLTERASEGVDNLEERAEDVVESIKRMFEKAANKSMTRLTNTATDLLERHAEEMAKLAGTNANASRDHESRLARQASGYAESLKNQATEHLDTASRFLSGDDGRLAETIERAVTTALATADKAHISAVCDLLAPRTAKLDKKAEEHVQTLRKEVDTATAAIRNVGNTVARNRRRQADKLPVDDGGQDARRRDKTAGGAGHGSRDHQPSEAADDGA